MQGTLGRGRDPRQDRKSKEQAKLWGRIAARVSAAVLSQKKGND